MNTSATSIDSRNSRRVLLPYALGVVGFNALIHLTIIVVDSQPNTLLIGGLTAVLALFYTGFAIVRRSVLKQIRFGPLAAHAVAYVTVVGGFQLHAAILTLSGSSALLGTEDFAVNSDWFGPTFAMAGFWAIGLTIHAITSIAQRGFEE